MREILFRGKMMDADGWVYGTFLKDGEPFKINLNHPVSNCYIVPETDLDNIKSKTSGGAYFLQTTAFHVFPETVGQYTGLTDKNGKKIFEGDILKQKTTAEFVKVNPFEWERYGIVRFGCYDWTNDRTGYASMGWYIEPLRSVSIKPKNYCVGHIQPGLNQSDILNEYYPMEVIGNIHDNPELLKGE